MCNPRQEGHNHAKRHAAFTTNQKGISLDEQLGREMKCSDACFDRNYNGSLHNQLTPLIRWGQTYDEIASPNNYAWAFDSWVTAFVIKSYYISTFNISLFLSNK